jgi:hypothetical protein
MPRISLRGGLLRFARNLTSNFVSNCDPDASGEAILMNDCHRCIGRTNPLSTFYHLNRHHRDPDAIASEAKQSPQHLLPLNGRHCDPDVSGEAILMNDSSMHRPNQSSQHFLPLKPPSSRPRCNCERSEAIPSASSTIERPSLRPRPVGGSNPHERLSSMHRPNQSTQHLSYH